MGIKNIEIKIPAPIPIKLILIFMCVIARLVQASAQRAWRLN